MVVAAVVVVGRRVAVGADVEANTIAADDALEDELPHAILGNGSQVADDVGASIGREVISDGSRAYTATTTRSLQTRDLTFVVGVAEGIGDRDAIHPGARISSHGAT